ncbi:MAG TPA: hypothetical protein PLZ55_13125, partial [bacterium]|nr:hypothetical protein [bacterium]
MEWQKIRAGQSFTEAVAALLGENPYAVAQTKSPDTKHSPDRDRAPAGTGGAGFDSLDGLSAAVRKYGTVENVYHYGSENENHLIVYRIKTDSGKIFKQCRREGGRYHFSAPAKPHPLYRRDLVSTAETVIIPEGEKCCDVINALDLPGIVAVTSAGGAQNAKSADWSPLSDKRLILWPDHDKPGRGYIQDVIDCLKALPNPPREIREIDPAELGLQEKQDAYDYLHEDRNLQDALAKAQP